MRWYIPSYVSVLQALSQVARGTFKSCGTRWICLWRSVCPFCKMTPDVRTCVAASCTALDPEACAITMGRFWRSLRLLVSSKDGNSPWSLDASGRNLQTRKQSVIYSLQCSGLSVRLLLPFWWAECQPKRRCRTKLPAHCHLGCKELRRGFVTFSHRLHLWHVYDVYVYIYMMHMYA